MDYSALSIKEYIEGIKTKKFTATDAVTFFADRCKQDKRNAVLEIFGDWKKYAAAVDRKVANGETLGALAGVPIIIKDNILFKGHIASAGSKMLEKFVSPYNATIVDKMLAADAVLLGRANMDEFAMGTTNETSAYGACINALSDKHVAGGSSGGSAVAAASGLCLAAIGTDTGGSVREPASFNGVVGIKPTYGAVSRYGLIAYASSLEQAGVVAKTTADCKAVLEVMLGKDPKDTTTITKAPRLQVAEFDIKNLKIGRVKEVWEAAKNIENLHKYNGIFEWYAKNGAEIVDISVKDITKSLAAYYIITPAQAATNLARYDGVKYTTASSDAKNLGELYRQTRGRYFGTEVKRRIIIGNFVLSSGHYDAYYTNALRLQKEITHQFGEAFKKADCILLPTTLDTAIELGKTTNPVDAYLEDLFTVPANIAGIPAISVPCGKAKNGLPIGLQILTDKFNEKTMFEIADYFEKNFEGRA